MTEEMRAFMVYEGKQSGRLVKFNKSNGPQFSSRAVEKLLNIDKVGASSEITPEEEHAANLDGWIEESYRDLIDETEYLDSSRVKRID